MKFYTVCTLPHYHPEDVYRLKQQLDLFYDGVVDMYVYTDRPEAFNDSVNVVAITHNKCVRQWYKVDFFGYDIVTGNEPVIVIDLDWVILDDVTDIIDMPITRNQFAAVERWWRQPTDKVKLNGGMYKFYPGTCIQTYNTFHAAADMWQERYYGPRRIKGEQNFVYDIVSRSHEIVFFPGERIGRYRKNYEPGMEVYCDCYREKYNLEYFSNNTFNPQIALIHGRF